MDGVGWGGTGWGGVGLGWVGHFLLAVYPQSTMTLLVAASVVSVSATNVGVLHTVGMSRVTVAAHLRA